MAENITQNKLIIVLVAVLLAVVAASGIILLLLPSDDSSVTPEVAVDDRQTGATTPIETRTSSDFRLEVLQRQAYQLINKQLVREGALPVKPPAAVGKANPFL